MSTKLHLLYSKPDYFESTYWRLGKKKRDKLFNTAANIPTSNVELCSIAMYRNYSSHISTYY